MYGSALVTARSQLSGKLKKVIEAVALITNNDSGAWFWVWRFSSASRESRVVQNTFLIIVLCNVIHFFSTPYLMMKESLAKMNASWETTAMLMGDSWIKTVFRVVTPNAMSTIISVFSYYFINAMVTISAVIFLAGARTMVITTQIKQLQYYNKYNEIFVLSLLLLLTNLAAKLLFGYLSRRKAKTAESEQMTEGAPVPVQKSRKLKTAKRMICTHQIFFLVFFHLLTLFYSIVSSRFSAASITLSIS